ncbi:MAG: riboflavin synthase [Hyphomicrobiales bacterium]|nr:riboflavin synthase [Hyphomicrobiales bacterium]MBV9976689.1 riboflavin synthase [Hyphomicrobiales bacterium]
MFTGIVTDIGEVAAISANQGTLKRIRLHSHYAPESIALGASIACSGPCLTVVAKGERPGGSWFEVEAAAETLALTTLGEWATGTRVNLERSLKIGDELGGHLVTGHVDATARIAAREDITPTDDPFGATARFFVEVPAETAPFIARKGSVALDGVSLTVNGIEKNTLSVLLIPHSLKATTFAERKANDRLNLEVDLMARYAARLAEARGGR